MGLNNIENGYNDPKAISELEAIRAIQAKALEQKRLKKLGKLEEAEERGDIVYKEKLN